MFKLEFKTDNEAFYDLNAESEISRILMVIQEQVSDFAPLSHGVREKIRDINGNTIGEWFYDLS